MERFYIFLITCLFLLSFPAISLASDRCDEFYENGQHYNDLMREKSTQYYKDKHRYWMDKYYECTKQRDRRSASKSQTPLLNNTTLAKRRNPKNVQPPARGNYSRSVISQSYHTFKGTKLDAWNNFFKESPECINNNSNMQTFVKCSAERKDYLKRFNLLWNEETQSLDSPLLN